MGDGSSSQNGLETCYLSTHVNGIRGETGHRCDAILPVSNGSLASSNHNAMTGELFCGVWGIDEEEGLRGHGWDIIVESRTPALEQPTTKDILHPLSCCSRTEIDYIQQQTTPHNHPNGRRTERMVVVKKVTFPGTATNLCHRVPTILVLEIKQNPLVYNMYKKHIQNPFLSTLLDNVDLEPVVVSNHSEKPRCGEVWPSCEHRTGRPQHGI